MKKTKFGTDLVNAMGEALAHARGKKVPGTRLAKVNLGASDAALRAAKSDALGAIHELMDGFRRSGAIDQQTMGEFDEACLAGKESDHPEDSEPIASSKKPSH